MLPGTQPVIHACLLPSPQYIHPQPIMPKLWYIVAVVCKETAGYEQWARSGNTGEAVSCAPRAEIQGEMEQSIWFQLIEKGMIPLLEAPDTKEWAGQMNTRRGIGEHQAWIWRTPECLRSNPWATMEQPLSNIGITQVYVRYNSGICQV